jgi:putative transposase
VETLKLKESLMKKLKFSESKIAAILKEVESGIAVAEASRKHGVSANTIYQWRSKYGGMSVSDMQRLRELESENARLKKMYAELSMDNAILKEALTKKF